MRLRIPAYLEVFTKQGALESGNPSLKGNPYSKPLKDPFKGTRPWALVVITVPLRAPLQGSIGILYGYRVSASSSPPSPTTRPLVFSGLEDLAGTTEPVILRIGFLFKGVYKGYFKGYFKGR